MRPESEEHFWEKRSQERGHFLRADRRNIIDSFNVSGNMIMHLPAVFLDNEAQGTTALYVREDLQQALPTRTSSNLRSGTLLHGRLVEEVSSCDLGIKNEG